MTQTGRGLDGIDGIGIRSAVRGLARPPLPRAPMRGGIAVFLAGLTLAASSSAAPPSGDKPDAPQTAPDREACLAAHRSAQELRKAGMLVEAGKKLLICTSASCPGPIISDCGTWTSELEVATPSIVFEIEVDGHVATDAKVEVDHTLVNDWSHAVNVNPGTHVVRVTVPSFPTHEETVVMAEGHRMRLMSIRFDTPKPTPLPSADSGAAGESSSVHTHRPVPVVTYPLLGAGVAGLAVFGVFAALGKSKQNGLEHNCAPRCTDSQLKPMKNDYLIGDVGLGVGVAALVASAVVYFTRPEVETRSAPGGLSLELGPTGSDVRRTPIWGASATLRW